MFIWTTTAEQSRHISKLCLVLVYCVDIRMWPSEQKNQGKTLVSSSKVLTRFSSLYDVYCRIEVVHMYVCRKWCFRLFMGVGTHVKTVALCPSRLDTATKATTLVHKIFGGYLRSRGTRMSV